jgi:proteasome lid subunit RPN8/RPN11
MIEEREAIASVVHLPAAVLRALRERAAAGYPHETCGVLVGRSTAGRIEVVRQEPAANLDRERARDRYLLDPEAFLRIDAAAREEGLDVVGIWHSHPDHPARPSATDLERAWEGWAYVIVSVGAGGARELRSWTLAAGAFVEQSVVEERA